MQATVRQNETLPAADFCEFMRSTIGRNWVVARRTARIVRRYGDNVVCLSQKGYSKLRAQHEAKAEA